MITRLTKIGVLFALLFCSSVPMSAQEDTEAPEDSSKEDNFDFVPVPYISYNRSVGAMLGALPMAMYKINPEDTISPSSITGLLGLYTTNDTWLVMTFSKLYFLEDRWRVVFAAATGTFNFQFFVADPINQHIDYGTDMVFAKIEVQRRVVEDLYFGFNYTYSEFVNQFEIAPGFDTTTTLQGVGAILTYDIRDNVYYPETGYLANLRYDTYPKAFDNLQTSQKITIDYQQFWSQGEKNVIAARAFGGFGIGDISFNQQFIVGNIDLRGYTQGTYRGDQMMAVQGEYRWNFYNKMSAVGFGGVASVFNSINSEFDGRLLPAVGVGFRYVVFEENHMNVGLDAAVGDGDWGIYFRIGEAF